MMKWLLSALFGAAAVLAADSASAGLCAQFAASSINVSYDPLGTQGTSQIIQPVSLSVARRDEGNNDVSVQAQFVDWDSDAVRRVGYGGPIYSIRGGGGTVVVGRTDAPLMPGQYFTYQFQSQHPGDYESVNGLQFYIDPGQDVPAGTYQETLGMQFRCSDGDSTEFQSGVLHVNVEVPSKLIANLSGGTTSGELDFGDFSDTSRGAVINVYSTGPFLVKIDSDNNGRMLLGGASASLQDAQISYNLYFNGRSVSFGNPIKFSRTGVGGTGLPLVVQTEDAQEKRAGTYQDMLTITITPILF